MYYPATLTPHNDGSGRYDVSFVDLSGCVSQGCGLEHALQMAQEALQLHLATMVEDGDALPVPSTIAQAQEKDALEAREEGYTAPDGTLYQFVVADAKKKEPAATPIRLSISLKPVIVERIDAVAFELGLTRSGLISVATREYCNRMQP